MAVTAPTTAPRTAFRLFPVQVSRAVRLTPHMVKVTFAGQSLSGLVTGGWDQRGKLLLPLAGQTEPSMPEGADELGWYAAWRQMPPETRPILRTYTIRAQRRVPPEIDIDFVLHGDLGPASRWAATASAGDRVLVCGPAREQAGGVDFRLPPEAGQVILAGDETALPAIASILESLPAGLPAHVLAETSGPAEEQALPGTADVHWLHRGEGPSRLVDAVRAMELTGAEPYFWGAGEASAIREIRRHLIGERGVGRQAVCVRGYWRAGLTEDDDD